VKEEGEQGGDLSSEKGRDELSHGVNRHRTQTHTGKKKYSNDPGATNPKTNHKPPGSFGKLKGGSPAVDGSRNGDKHSRVLNNTGETDRAPGNRESNKVPYSNNRERGGAKQSLEKSCRCTDSPWSSPGMPKKNGGVKTEPYYEKRPHGPNNWQKWFNKKNLINLMYGTRNKKTV